MKKTILFIPLMYLLFGFTSQHRTAEISKEALIKKLLTHEDLKSSKWEGRKLAIGQYDFCATHDCVDYFKDYQDKIRICSAEYIFVRGRPDYVVIKEIDEANNTMNIILKSKNGDKAITIKE